MLKKIGLVLIVLVALAFVGILILFIGGSIFGVQLRYGVVSDVAWDIQTGIDWVVLYWKEGIIGAWAIALAVFLFLKLSDFFLRFIKKS
jgi:hypothetical protein